jgi:hypothetical protein
MLRYVLILSALVFGLGIIYITLDTFGIGSQLNFAGPGDVIVATAVAAAVMLAGVFLGALYRRIMGKSDPINIFGELLQLLKAPDFWSSLCISPLVFLATFALTRDDPLQMSNLVLIFQNGFFCDVIFKKIAAKVSRR